MDQRATADLIQATVISYPCTLENVVEISKLIAALGVDSEAEFKKHLDIYGSLRSAGFNHSRLMANMNMIWYASKVFEIVDKPNFKEELPKIRLVRED